MYACPLLITQPAAHHCRRPHAMRARRAHITCVSICALTGPPHTIHNAMQYGGMASAWMINATTGTTSASSWSTVYGTCVSTVCLSGAQSVIIHAHPHVITHAHARTHMHVHAHHQRKIVHPSRGSGGAGKVAEYINTLRETDDNVIALDLGNFFWGMVTPRIARRVAQTTACRLSSHTHACHNALPCPVQRSRESVLPSPGHCPCCCGPQRNRL